MQDHVGNSMTMQGSVAALKQRFENLFPGKWVNVGERQKILLTGLSEIDHSLTRGLARQRITEWVGPPSSGKTSALRAIINYWCTRGFDVAYVDAEDRLVASDWTFLACEGTNISGVTAAEGMAVPCPYDRHHVKETPCDVLPGVSKKIPVATALPQQGKFWVIRNLHSATTPDLHSFTKLNHRWKGKSLKQNHLWAADELIRANAFDVVVLDLGASERMKPIHSRIYARLQNSLGKSKTALIILRDTEAYEAYSRDTDYASQLGWGSYARLNFNWGATFKNISGLMGTAMIVPSIQCNVVKDGLSQAGEVSFTFNVSNRLFTHSPVPDRRTPKT